MRAAFLSAAARLHRFEEPEVGQQSLFSQETTNIAMPTDWTFARASDDYAVAYDGTVVNVSSNQPAVHGGRWTGSAWSRVDGSGNPLIQIEDIVADGPSSHTRPVQYVPRSTLNSHYGVLGTRYHLNGFAYEVTTANDLAASPPTSLTTTTSATGTDGSATVTCRGRYAQPSIHIGPARTNVVTNSQVTNTDWNDIGTAMAATINNGVGPDNTQDLTLLSNTGGQSFHAKAFRLSGQTPGTLYTLSAVFRSSTALTGGLQFYNFSGSLSVLIARLTYATGAVDDNTGGGGGTFTALGVNPLANNCYQVWMHVTVPSGCSVFDVRVIPNRDNTVAASWVGWANAMVGHVDPRLCLIKTTGSAKTVAAAEMRIPNADLQNVSGAALVDLTAAQRTVSVQQQLVAADSAQDVLGTQSTGKIRAKDASQTIAGHLTPTYQTRKRFYSRWQSGRLECGGVGELCRTASSFTGTWARGYGHVKVTAGSHMLVHDVAVFASGQERDVMIGFSVQNDPPPLVYSWLDDWDRHDPPAPDQNTLDVDQFGYPRVVQTETKNVNSGTLEQMLAPRVLTFTGQAMSAVNSLHNRNPSAAPVFVRAYTVQEYQAYGLPAGDIGKGPAFDATGSISQYSGGVFTIFAGHWLYEAGSTTTQAINASATSVTVQSAAPFGVGRWVCIRNGTGNNWTNAEHCQVTGITTGGGINTLTLGSRGYKSTAVSHASGSYVAPHAVGQTGDNRGWFYNMGLVSCPNDGAGRSWGEVALDHLEFCKNMDGNGTLFNNVVVKGWHGDVDAWYLGDMGDALVDIDNNGTADAGVVGGVNDWGEGFDWWYEAVRTRFPGWIVMAGSRQSGVATNFGAQSEHMADGNFYAVNPDYAGSFRQWVCHIKHNRAHAKYGPNMTNVLMKTPTLSWPVSVTGDDTATVVDDSSARLTCAAATVEGALWGPENQAPTPHEAFDFESVNLSTGITPTRNNTDDSAWRAGRGWLGHFVRRRGIQRWRVVNPTTMKPSQALMNAQFTSGTTGWSGTGCTISNPSGWLRATPTGTPNSNIAGARVNGPDFSLTSGTLYTLMFNARTNGAKQRMASIECGRVNDLIPIATVFDTYVMTWTQNSSLTDSLDFKLGRDAGTFDVDWAMVFATPSGVMRADYEHGIVVYNGTTASQIVDLGGEFKAITGTQQPSVDNGAIVSQVTIPAWDGRFLLRTG